MFGCSGAYAPTVGPRRRPRRPAESRSRRPPPAERRRPTRPRALPTAHRGDRTADHADPSPPPTTDTDGDDGGTRRQHVHDPGLGRPASPHLGDRHGPAGTPAIGATTSRRCSGRSDPSSTPSISPCATSRRPSLRPAPPPDGSYPTYGVPAQIAPALAASGFDRCSVASNHSLDKGEAGIDSTLNALDAAGVGHAGNGPDAAGGRSGAVRRPRHDRCPPVVHVRVQRPAAPRRPAMAVEPDRPCPHRGRRPAGACRRRPVRDRLPALGQRGFQRRSAPPSGRWPKRSPPAAPST